MMQVNTIVVPIDFSEYSLSSLRYANEFARNFDAELVLVYVVEPMIYPADFSFGHVITPSVDEQLSSQGQARLDVIAKEEVGEGLRVRAVVRTGKPFVEIIRCAKEEKANLIIIATHGHSGIEHVLFGSTAEKVVRKAPCPVLSIRSPEREFVMP